MIGWEPDYYKTLDELPEEMPQVLKTSIKRVADTNNNTIPPVCKKKKLSFEIIKLKQIYAKCFVIIITIIILVIVPANWELAHIMSAKEGK